MNDPEIKPGAKTGEVGYGASGLSITDVSIY